MTKLAARRCLIMLALTLGCAEEDPAQPEARTSTPPFHGDVVLGRPTDSGVTLSLLSDQAARVYVEYAANGSAATHSSAVQLAAGVPSEIELGQLRSNTRYEYRVLTGGSGDTAATVNHFHTQRTRGMSFTFVLDADPHYGESSYSAAVYGRALASMRADDPDFLIDLGDSFMTEKRAPASYLQVLGIVSGLRPLWATLTASAPLFLVIGNHEGEQGWQLNGAGENLGVWATRARQYYYPNPQPGSFYSGSSSIEPFIGRRDSYYAYEWGDALFVVIDPYWYTPINPKQDYWDWTLGSAQYEWLARTLRLSSARYKFVFTHQLIGGLAAEPRGGIETAPYYEWGGRDPDGTYRFAQERSGWSKPIHHLLVETRVTAVFHGHDHFFARQELDGIVYQLVPQPSFARTDDRHMAVEYGYRQGVFLTASGYLRIQVSPVQARVEYVKVYPEDSPGRRTGDVAYSYTLTPR